MDLNDDYRKLGLSNDASLKDIKKAYRQKAQKLHPDKRAEHDLEAENEFKEMNSSYHNILNNFNNKTSNQVHINDLGSTEFRTKQNKKTNENPQTRYKPDFESDSSLFNRDLNNFFDIFNKFFTENLISRQKNQFSNIFRSTNQSSRNYSLDSSNKCSGGHDKYTICLKCHNQNQDL